MAIHESFKVFSAKFGSMEAQLSEQSANVFSTKIEFPQFVKVFSLESFLVFGTNLACLAIHDRSLMSGPPL